MKDLGNYTINSNLFLKNELLIFIQLITFQGTKNTLCDGCFEWKMLCLQRDALFSILFGFCIYLLKFSINYLILKGKKKRTQSSVVQAHLMFQSVRFQSEICKLSRGNQLLELSEKQECIIYSQTFIRSWPSVSNSGKVV